MVELTTEQVKEITEAARLIIKGLDESMRADDEVNMSADSGTNDLKFEQVKAGHKLVLLHLSGYDDTSSPTRIRVGYWNGHRLNWLKGVPAPLVAETVGIAVRAYLREGMYPIVRFEGATSGDDLYATLNGYYIKT